MKIRKIARRITDYLPENLGTSIRAFAPGRRLLKKIEALQAPRHVVLRDGTEWRRVDDCPKPLLDPGGAQIGTLMYVIGGFPSGDAVSDAVHVYDMQRRRWSRPIPVPADLPHSHSAVATDGARYIYIAGGQVGPECRPSCSTVYCFDTLDASWHRLPDLPQARYAGTMQLRDARLHFIGGADRDRWTPRSEHWTLGVSGSRATGPGWVEERPIPVPGMHRSSALVDGSIYVIGGQQGDFQAIPDDANYTCTSRTQETYLAAVFRLPPEGDAWQRMADLPIAVSHCDFSCLVVDGTIHLYGGQVFKHPETFALRLTNAIQAYDTATDSWTISGYLPYHLKMPIIGRHGDAVFLTVGQRGRTTTDRPGEITATTWQTTVPAKARAPAKRLLPSVGKRRVLLVSHQLTRSGAPLELLELGQAMIDSDAEVRLVTLDGDMTCNNLSADFKIPLVPPETALSHAGEADLIVVNTTHQTTRDWVAAGLERAPELADRILWLVHEIDVEEYAACAPVLRKVRAAAFDSAACLRAWDEVGGLPGVAETVFPGLPRAVFEAATQPKQAFAKASQWLLAEPVRLLSRAEIRAALGIREDEIVILSVGTVSTRKGQKMLLTSVARAARDRGLPLKLLLAGFSSETRRTAFLRDLDADERKVFNPRLAYLNTPYIDALFSASDLHVLNAQGEHGRGETFGRVTVHAMAHGLPVLGTKAGGTPEIFDDGVQGYHYPVGEAGQAILIDRLEALASDPALRRRMGKAAVVHAKAHFLKDRYLAEMNSVMDGVLREPHLP